MKDNRVANVNDAGLVIYDNNGSEVYKDTGIRSFYPLKRGPDGTIYAFCFDGVRKLSEDGHVVTSSAEKLELHRACITNKGLVVGIDEVPGANPKDFKAYKEYAICFDPHLMLRWRKKLEDMYPRAARRLDNSPNRQHAH